MNHELELPFEQQHSSLLSCSLSLCVASSHFHAARVSSTFRTFSCKFFLNTFL